MRRKCIERLHPAVLDVASYAFVSVSRNKLFSISGRRGTYPQFFLLGEESVEFVGDFETIEAMNDASALPCEILERHPEIMTWEKILK